MASIPILCPLSLKGEKAFNFDYPFVVAQFIALSARRQWIALLRTQMLSLFLKITLTLLDFHVAQDSILVLLAAALVWASDQIRNLGYNGIQF